MSIRLMSGTECSYFLVLNLDLSCTWIENLDEERVYSHLKEKKSDPSIIDDEQILVIYQHGTTSSVKELW